MTQILVGCDPEYFVKKNGIFQSAHGLIMGDKKNPQKVRNGAVQVDGMAVEFNIDPALVRMLLYSTFKMLCSN